jgi:hypothetical protein
MPHIAGRRPIPLKLAIQSADGVGVQRSILTYATPDGELYFRKERALTSFTDIRDTTAAVDANPDSLGPVDDPDLQERYAAEAQRMEKVHDPDDVI